MSRLPVRRLLALIVTFSIASHAVHAQSVTLGARDILGTDFVAGAAAADIASYVTPFLQSGRTFELSSQWAEGRFIVRDTDANNRPLVGPSSTGAVDGALIAYRAGLRVRLPAGVSLFALTDYFVASHLDSFFDLLTPSKVAPGNNITGGSWNANSGLYYLAWFVPYGLVDGGGLTGFTARAVQVLPGISLSIPFVGLGVQAGVIFRYRDPIDTDGRFISRYYVDSYPSDYRSRDDIPSGIGAEERQELFFAAQLFGIEADALLTPTGSLAYISLLRNLADLMPDTWGITRFVPQIQYFDALAQRIRDRAVINPSLEATVQQPLPDGRTLSWTPSVSWLQDPIAFQNAALEVGYRGFVLGGSLQDHQDLGLLPGVRLGFAPEFDGVNWLVLDVRYNYVGGAVGAVEIIDRPLFTLEVRF